MTARTFRSAAAALLLGAAAVLARVDIAHAHGALRSSVPASGAHLAAAPRELRLTFNERVELAVALVQLRGPDGALVALSALRAGSAPETIVADVTGPLTAGTYVVAWRVAGRDGHPVRGDFRFTIAPGASGLARDAAARDSTLRDSMPRDSAAHHDPTAMPSGGAFDAQSPAYAAVRWLGFVATFALIGAVAFALLVVPGAARRGAPAAWTVMARVGARRVGTLAAVGLLAVAALRLVAQDAAMHGTAGMMDPSLVGAMLGGTTWGAAWLLHSAAAVGALTGAALARRAPPVGWSIAGAAAMVVAVAAALGGHAAAVPRVAAMAVVTDTVHVLGAGGWLGTLLLVTLVGVPAALRLEPDARGRAAAAVVHAFSPLALTFAGAAALSGVVSASIHLDGVAALWTTAYGRTLLVKLGALSLVAATGYYNWRRVRIALGDEVGAHRVRRSAALELAVGGVVLAVTSVLVATPPHTP